MMLRFWCNIPSSVSFLFYGYILALALHSAPEQRRLVLQSARVVQKQESFPTQLVAQTHSQGASISQVMSCLNTIINAPLGDQIIQFCCFLTFYSKHNAGLQR